MDDLRWGHDHLPSWDHDSITYASFTVLGVASFIEEHFGVVEGGTAEQLGANIGDAEASYYDDCFGDDSCSSGH